jgi:glycine/D-amino acid oxidase-like deaminating enzyme
MSVPATTDRWGIPPWTIDFHPPKRALPDAVDVAIIGGGFSGLSAAAWLRHISSETSVALFESEQIGSGASGRTGGLALAESAAGDLPGLGDVLAGVSSILQTLEVDGDLLLSGAWELARGAPLEKSSGVPVAESQIRWSDSGDLRVISEVPGGTVDPGKLVSGLASAAHRLGVQIFEGHPVRVVAWRPQPVLEFAGGEVRAKKVLIAANALSLGLSGLDQLAHARLTLAASTSPLSDEQLAAIGLAKRKPFYTVDLPYLWGRLCADNSIVWGAGLVAPPRAGDLTDIHITSPEPASMFSSLERRVRGLHPALASVSFKHRWGGPISFREGWMPAFAHHPESSDGLVLGAYAGHGVALSVYFGAWAAEALLGRRELPDWGRYAVGE